MVVKVAVVRGMAKRERINTMTMSKQANCHRSGNTRSAEVLVTASVSRIDLAAKPVRGGTHYQIGSP